MSHPGRCSPKNVTMSSTESRRRGLWTRPANCIWSLEWWLDAGLLANWQHCTFCLHLFVLICCKCQMQCCQIPRRLNQNRKALFFAIFNMQLKSTEHDINDSRPVTIKTWLRVYAAFDAPFRGSCKSPEEHDRFMWLNGRKVVCISESASKNVQCP